MKVRVVEWFGDFYIVVGFGYDSTSDPPDILHCIPLGDAIVRSILTYSNYVKIPLSEAVEITDEKRIRALLALFF